VFPLTGFMFVTECFPGVNTPGYYISSLSGFKCCTFIGFQIALKVEVFNSPISYVLRLEDGAILLLL